MYITTVSVYKRLCVRLLRETVSLSLFGIECVFWFMSQCFFSFFL